jgi:hypothetical protein
MKWSLVRITPYLGDGGCSVDDFLFGYSNAGKKIWLPVGLTPANLLLG